MTPSATPDARPRCTVESLADGEPLAGTAPEDSDWLLVEEPGPWGRQALAESRLPEPVRAGLARLEDVRVQLIRRPAAGPGEGGPAGARVFRARLGPDGAHVEAARIDRPEELLDLGAVAFTAYDAPLWLVCTNGRRDVCCAERGRPVAAALAARWPDATWETTHLGGHRFAATLLALPSGIALGRLDPEAAVAACGDLSAGRLPLEHARGRAGLPVAAQAAELHVRCLAGLDRLAEVRVTAIEGDRVTVAHPGGASRVDVASRPGPPRRLSCADPEPKVTPVLTPHLADGDRPHR